MAAHRLHRGLIDLGVDSRMLVQYQFSDDDKIFGPATKLQKKNEQVRSFLDQVPVRRYRKRSGTLFSPAWTPSSRRFRKTIGEFRPHVVHLHWINSGFVGIRDFRALESGIVWTIHDKWAFTGGCHYNRECRKYVEACQDCPLLNAGRKDDLALRTFKRKEKYLMNKEFTVVSPSRWLAGCARESALLGKKRIEVIPNGLDTRVFRPVDKSAARKQLGLSQSMDLLLFGAVDSLGDPRKGVQYLLDSCATLKVSYGRNFGVLVFGDNGKSSEFEKKLAKIGIGLRRFGFISEEEELARLYSAADAMLMPSLEEAFGQTASEAMACGTPVAAFDATGPKDIVDHKKTGYLAEPMSAEDLARGVDWILAQESNKLSAAARKKIVNDFDIGRVAAKYMAIYKDILKNGKK